MANWITKKLRQIQSALEPSSLHSVIDVLCEVHGNSETHATGVAPATPATVVCPNCGATIHVAGNDSDKRIETVLGG
jgi:hypothetical protein